MLNPLNPQDAFSSLLRIINQTYRWTWKRVLERLEIIQLNEA